MVEAGLADVEDRTVDLLIVEGMVVVVDMEGLLLLTWAVVEGM